jgi:hypothetical protein
MSFLIRVIGYFIYSTINLVMERKVIRQKVAKTDRQGEELLTTVKEWGNARTPENRIG